MYNKVTIRIRYSKLYSLLKFKRGIAIMKKILIFVILILVSFTILSGCGSTNSDDGPAVTPPTEPKEQTEEVVLYFSDNDLMNNYRVKTEIVIKEGEQVEKAALEAWIKGPENDELTALMNKAVTVEYVKDVDGIANVSFSKEIQVNNLGSTGELMLAEQISMIMEQFGYEKTQILVEGKVVETLLGHLDVTQPIIADDPENYLWIDEIEPNKIVIQNQAFIVFEPAPNTVIQKDNIIVKGLARVYEATFNYEFEDGHFVLDEGTTMASEGAPGWGEFEIIIQLDEIFGESGTIILYEESAKDGSRINELIIPIKVFN